MKAEVGFFFDEDHGVVDPTRLVLVVIAQTQTEVNMLQEWDRRTDASFDHFANRATMLEPRSARSLPRKDDA